MAVTRSSDVLMPSRPLRGPADAEALDPALPAARGPASYLAAGLPSAHRMRFFAAASGGLDGTELCLPDLPVRPASGVSSTMPCTP